MSKSIAILALTAVIGVPAAHAGDTAAVPALSVAPPAAQWVERKLDYTYMGFTTHYSCDGLVDNVRDVLLELGARRKDLKVQSSGCTRFEGPEHFPGVVAHFWVLVPVTPDDIGKIGGAAVSSTQWQTVDLLHKPQFHWDQGQCELLEQLKDKALPLFTTRNLNFQSTCFPHEISPGDLKFTVDVLRPTPAAPAGAAGAPAT